MSIRGRRRWLPSIEQLLPLACLGAAALLFASELMTTFEFRPPGREALADQTAADRHGYGLAVLAGFAFLATLVAVTFASKPAAVSVGVTGVIALLVFLIIDLPDVNAVGTLEDGRQSFFDAEAVPQAGFWLELVGALSLAVSGIALATLSPQQLAALRPRRFAPGEVEPAEDPATASSSPPSAPPAAESPAQAGDESEPARRRQRAGALDRYQR